MTWLWTENKGTDSMPYHLRASKFKADRQVFLEGGVLGCCNVEACIPLFGVLYWLPKVLALIAVIFSILSTIDAAERTCNVTNVSGVEGPSLEKGEEVAAIIFFVVSLAFELFASIQKVLDLRGARKDYIKVRLLPTVVSGAGIVPTSGPPFPYGDQLYRLSQDRRNIGKNAKTTCCAWDTTWPLLGFHTILPLMIIGGYISNDLKTRAVLTILAPFLWETCVNMVHEKIEAEIVNIRGDTIETVKEKGSTDAGVAVARNNSTATDPEGASPSCPWVLC